MVPQEHNAPGCCPLKIPVGLLLCKVHNTDDMQYIKNVCYVSFYSFKIPNDST